jgi:UDP-N-acetyl-D-galactosamine dehydrogenase
MKVGIIGLGYVGLPLAIAFQKKYDVYAYDNNNKKIAQLKNNYDKTNELSKKELKNLSNIKFSNKISDLKDCKIFIIAVPTPINKKNNPDLSILKKACVSVAKIMKINSIVVFESTVYPGVTEEICVPILSKYSALKYNKEFFCGYSPERINPGDKIHNINNIVKLTSGSTEKISRIVDNLYSKVIDAGTYRAKSIKIAEAAKSIENAQRDINIAFINELKIIFDKMNLDLYEILKAAQTKWNFLKFEPGLVGGHCIGVDPYYLSYISQKYKHVPRIILSGRNINDNFHNHIIEDFAKKFKKPILRKKILILGFAFKENCRDCRNTKINNLYKGLKKKGFKVEIFDPHVDKKDVWKVYKIKILSKIKKNKYDGVIVAVKHDYFKKIGLNKIISFCKKKHVLYNFKNLKI